jgi:Ca2+-binding RTX toxin-like protein
MAVIRDPGVRTLNGTSDHDLIFVTRANFTVYGGDGHDYFVIEPGTRADFQILSGDAGFDTADFSLLTLGVTATLGSTGIVYGPEVGTTVLRGFESFVGSQAADNITGSRSADVIDGSGGNDYIDAGRGNDVVTGGAGADRFAFGYRFGQDVVTDFETAGAEHDTLSFGSFTFLTKQAVLDAATQVGGDVVITLDPANSLTLLGVSLAALTSDHIFIG